MAKTERSFGLLMVLGTCTLLQSIKTCIPSKTGCFIGCFFVRRD